MSSIDRRIIDMQFNNSRFERNIKQSLSSLDRLKSGLNLNQATQSLNNLENAASKFSLSSISKGVDSISSKFSAFGIAGVTALSNIVNKAVDAGIRITKALTIDPVMDGYKEMNTKFSSIGTILANTKDQGTTRNQVAESLDELNEYADKTVYNFAQMTQNIGKFTAAGVGLKDAVASVKGLGNIAATFGVGPEQMANATYQMSQALAAGKIQLLDWRSMESNSMGGKILQKELQNTAISMGTVIDKNKSFRDTLRDGWLTSTVFVETMKRLSEDEGMLKKAQSVVSFSKMMDTLSETVSSGWAQTFEILIGGSVKSTEIFTGLSQAIMGILSPFNDARNAAAKFWSEHNGRESLIQGFVNIFKALKRVLSPVADAFKLVFPNAAQVTGLIAISEQFRDLTATLMISKSTMEKIKGTFAGLFAFIDIIKMAVSGLATIIGTVLQTVLKRIFPLDSGLLGITASIGSMIIYIRNFIRDAKVFEASFETLATIVSVTTTVMNTAFNILPITLDLLKKAFYILIGVIYIASQKIYNSGLDKFIIKLQGCISDFYTVIKPKLEAIKGVFVFAFSKMVSAVESFKKSGVCIEFKAIKISLKDLYDYAEPVLMVIGGSFLLAFSKIVSAVDTLKKTGMPGLFSQITKAIGSLYVSAGPVLATIGKSIGKAIDVIVSVFSRLKDAISKSMPEMPNIGEIFSRFVKGFNGMAPLTKILGGVIFALVWVLENGFKLLVSVGKVFIDVIGNLFTQIKNTFSNADLGEMGQAAGGVAGGGVLAIVGIGLAKFIMKLIALAKDGSKFIDSIKGVFDSLTKYLSMMQASVKAEVIKKIAISVAILTAALIALTFIDPEKLALALAAITGLFLDLFASMSIFFKFIDPVKIAELTGISIFIGTLAVSCLILAGAMAILAKLNWNGIAKGLTGVIVILGALMGVSYAFTKLKIEPILIRTSISLILFGLALRTFIGPIQTLAQLSWNELSKGLTGVIVLLASLVGVSYLFTKLNVEPMLIRTSLALILFAGALKMLISPVVILSKLTWNELSKGLVGVILLLGSLAGASWLLSKATPDMIITSVGLIAVAFALSMLVEPIKAIGSMSLADILSGLLGLTVMLTAMSIFTKSIQKVSGFQFLTIAMGMTKLAGAMIAMASAIKIIGKIPLGEIIKGVTAIVITLYAISTALARIPNMSTAALQITIVSASLLILGKAIAVIGALSLWTIIKGVLAISVSMYVLSQALDNMTKGITGAAAILIVAPALMLLAGALALIGGLSIGTLVKSIIALSLIMKILSVSLNSMTKGIIGAAAIFIVAPALIVLASALDRIGSIDSNTLIKGLLGLAGAMLVLGVALTAMQASIAGSIALGIAAVSLMLLVPVLKGLGSLSLGEIGVALLALAGTFTILGLAGYIIGPLAPLVAMLAGAITLLGIGALAAGVGVMAFAAGMGMLALVGVPGMKAVTNMAIIFASKLPLIIALAATAVSKSINLIFSILLKTLTGMITLLLNTITTLAPKIVRTVGVLLSALIKMVEGLLPKVGKLYLALVTTILNVIKEFYPKIVKTFLKIIIGIIDALTENVPLIIKAGKDFVVSFLQGLAESYMDIAISAANLMYVMIVSITNAIETIVPQINTACARLIAVIIAAITLTMDTQVKAFNDLGYAIVEGIINGVAYSSGRLFTSINKLVKGAIKAAKEGLDSHSPSKEFEKIGADVVNGLTTGLEGKRDRALTSIKDIAQATIDESRDVLDSHSDSWEFIEIGKDMMGGLGTGFDKFGGGALEKLLEWIGKMKTEGQKVATSADSYAVRTKQANKSQEVIDKETEELTKANQTKEEKAAKAAAAAEKERAKEAAKNAEERRQQEKKEADDRQNAEEKQNQDIINARKNKLSAIESYIDEEKYYNRLSLQQELDIWETRISEFESNTDEYKKIAREIYRIQNEIGDEIFEKSKKWIASKTESGELKLTTDNPNEDSQLKAWARVRNRYKYGSDKYIEANKELARVEKEVYDAGYNFSKNWIENEKYYNKLALPGELAAWKRINSRYKYDSAEFKESAREIYRVEKEIEKSDKDFHDKLIDVHENFINDQKALDDDYYNSVSDINEQLGDDIDDLTKQYEDAVKSRADSIYQSYGLFERVEFNDQEQVRNSTGELLYWVDAAKLATTTAQTAYPVMQAINGKSLTDNLQTQVTSLKTWKASLDQLRKSGISQELIDELEAMGPASTAQIQALNRMNKYEISEYDKLWQEKKSLSKSEATAELNEMRVDTINSITALKANASTELDGVAQAWVNKTIALRGANQKELTKITNDYTTAVGIAETDINEEIKNLITSVQNTFNTPEYGKIWKSLGSNITKGIKEGMTAEDVSESSVDMLDTAVEKSNKTLGINSPSKVFAKMGKFSVLGFAKGISDNLSTIKDKSIKMAVTAKDSLAQTLSTLDTILFSESRPTIRPVIDMTDVNKGIDSTFNQTRGINMVATNDRASYTASTSRAPDSVQTSNNTTNNTKSDNRIILNVNYSVRNDGDIRKSSESLNNTLQKFNRSRGVPVYDG